MWRCGFTGGRVAKVEFPGLHDMRSVLCHFGMHILICHWRAEPAGGRPLVLQTSLKILIVVASRRTAAPAESDYRRELLGYRRADVAKQGSVSDYGSAEDGSRRLDLAPHVFIDE